MKIITITKLEEYFLQLTLSNLNLHVDRFLYEISDT